MTPYSNATFAAENYPGSQQTRGHGENEESGATRSASTPARPAPSLASSTRNWGLDERQGLGHHHLELPVNQLLAANNNGEAVGFYNDAKGNAHAYEWDRKTVFLSIIHLFASTRASATAINYHAFRGRALHSEADGSTVVFITRWRPSISTASKTPARETPIS